MEQTLEQILTDIYALEPGLKERDGEVRTLVRELLASRPEVVLDPHFASVLRARVLEQIPKPQAAHNNKPEQRDTLWWALRLAPIGAFAALTLALIGGPEGFEQPLTPEMVSDGYLTQTAPAPGNVRMPDPASASDTMMQMKSTPSSMGGGVSGDTDMASDVALMMEDSERSMAMSDSIFAADQPADSSVTIENVSLTVAGHVRIFAYEDGAPRAVLGTTEVLPAGASYNVQVALSRAVSPGETLYAQLFSSNGDEVFTLYEDEPLRNASGELIYVIFMIDSH